MMPGSALDCGLYDTEPCGLGRLLIRGSSGPEGRCRLAQGGRARDSGFWSPGLRKGNKQSSEGAAQIALFRAGFRVQLGYSNWISNL